MILVAGSTGLLGGEICRFLADAGKPFRALVRTTSDMEKVERLKQLGAELIHADLKDRASLDVACQKCTAVISTVSTTISRQEGDTIETVDRDGQLSLVDAARNAGVQQFVFISFPPIDPEVPLEQAKRAVESHLQKSGMKYTILQPVNFMEVWLSPAIGFDYPKRKVQVYGSGDNKVSWISFRDVAKFAVASIGNPSVYDSIIPLGGPDALSYNDAIKMFEDATGETFTVESIPAEALEAQKNSATDSLQKSFAGMMHALAVKEFTIEMEDTLKKLPVQMVSVMDYISEVAGVSAADA